MLKSELAVKGRVSVAQILAFTRYSPDRYPSIKYSDMQRVSTLNHVNIFIQLLVDLASRYGIGVRLRSKDDIKVFRDKIVFKQNIQLVQFRVCPNHNNLPQYLADNLRLFNAFDPVDVFKLIEPHVDVRENGDLKSYFTTCTEVLRPPNSTEKLNFEVRKRVLEVLYERILNEETFLEYSKGDAKSMHGLFKIMGATFDPVFKVSWQMYKKNTPKDTVTKLDQYLFKKGNVPLSKKRKREVRHLQKEQVRVLEHIRKLIKRS